jgi:hypothetical protein
MRQVPNGWSSAAGRDDEGPLPPEMVRLGPALGRRSRTCGAFAARRAAAARLLQRLVRPQLPPNAQCSSPQA